MTKISKLTDDIELKVFKSRDVKTPCKAWNAAGWDFFIPEDLKLKDFAKSYKSYLDDSVLYDFNSNKIEELKNKYFIPLMFSLKKGNETVSVSLYLKYEEEKNLEFYYLLLSENEKESVDKKLEETDEINNYNIVSILIPPNSKLNIPSGIHVNLPSNVFLKADNKSGIASKRGLTVMANIIDSDYQGEIHINLSNVNSLPVFINAGEKIIQLIPLFQPQMKTVVEYASLDDLYKNEKSERGDGGFGSSGEK